MSWRARIALGTFALLLCLVGYSTLIEPGWVRLHEKELCIPDWPEDLDGLRIAVLSDLHVGAARMGMDKLAWIVDETNRQSADMIVILGDLVIHGVPGGEFTAPEDISHELGRLTANLGVFSVLGNHDV